MVRGRVNSGVQSVVWVRKVMVVDMVGMVGMVRMLVVKVVKAVSRLRPGEAGSGMRSPPQRVTRGRSGGRRPQLDSSPRSRDRRLIGIGRRRRRCGTEKKRDSFGELAEQSWQDQRRSSRLSDDVA